MPRPKGSLNCKTLSAMVENGEICLLRDRMNCARCKAAREEEERRKIEAQIGAAAATPEMAGLFGQDGALTKQRPPGPAQAVMLDTFLEYRAPDGKEWRAERGADLLRDFDIAPAQIRQLMGLWHTAMAVQERLWLILRRLYGIAPMLGIQDAEEMRVWPLRELGEKLGLDDDAILAMVGEAKLYFLRYRASAVKERASVQLDARKPMTEADVAEVLARYDLEVIGDAQRRYAAKRCLDLQAWLEHEQGRPMAQSVIRQELLIFYVLDRRIAEHQAVVEEKKKSERERGVTGSVNDDLENERLGKLMKGRNEAVKSYEESMERLGATQVQTGSISKRMNAQLVFGKAIEGMQRYYANADNGLIDYFATEGEILIAAAETAIRPGQYRADVALGWMEAMENLWKPDYEPTPVGRERARRLAKEILGAVKRCSAPKADDETPTDLTPIEGEELQGAIAPVAPAPAGLGEAPAGQIIPMAPPYRRRDEGNEVAVF